MTKRKLIDELTAQAQEASRKVQRVEVEKARLSEQLSKLQAYTSELEAARNSSAPDLGGQFALLSKEAGNILGAALEEAERIKSKAREDAHTLISAAELHASSILGEADNKTILRLTAAEARAAELLRNAEERASAILLAADKTAGSSLTETPEKIFVPAPEKVKQPAPAEAAVSTAQVLAEALPADNEPPVVQALEAHAPSLPEKSQPYACYADEAVAVKKAKAEDANKGSAAIEQLRSRVLASMEVIQKQNEILASDVSRQTKAVLSALSVASNRVLLEGIGPEDCEELFSRCLAEALLTPVEEESSERSEKVGEIVFSSVSELQSLGGYGLRNNVIIKRAILPEGLETLPESFFFGCANLREVIFPKSLEAIGDYAFYGCVRLSKAKLPRELERIGDYAFSGCESLKSMELPLGLKRMGTAAFRNCGALQSMLVGRDCLLHYIGSHAMQNCVSLREFSIPEGVRVIPTSLFYGCGSLKELTIPASVERVEAEAFKNCVALRRVVFMSADTKFVPGALTGLENAELLYNGERLGALASEETISVSDLRWAGAAKDTLAERGVVPAQQMQ